MTNYRIFLLSFVTGSWCFLSGVNTPVNDEILATEKQKITIELKSVETENARKVLENKQINDKNDVTSNPQKTKITPIKKQNTRTAHNKNHTTSNEPEQPLDLSVPFKDSGNTDLKTEQTSAVQNRETTIFANETKKKPRSLELDGQFLMSPEPEAGKQKSVDGAGLVIRLKP